MGVLGSLKSSEPNRSTLGLPVGDSDIGEKVLGLYMDGEDLSECDGFSVGDFLALRSGFGVFDSDIDYFKFRILSIFKTAKGEVLFVCYAVGAKVVTVLDEDDLNLLSRCLKF